MKDYAVILKFDDVSSKKIEDLTKKINDIVGMNYTIPPHITLGVFRTDNIEAYDEIFKKFSEELKRTEVIFSSIGQFSPKVLYIAPLITEDLLDNHKIVNEMITYFNLIEIPGNYSHYQT